MTRGQIELLEIINNSLGHVITQVGEGSEARFFLGQVETPDATQYCLRLTGREVTPFFQLTNTIGKSEGQTKIEITEYISSSTQRTMTFSANIHWWVYTAH